MGKQGKLFSEFSGKIGASFKKNMGLKKRKYGIFCICPTGQVRKKKKKLLSRKLKASETSSMSVYLQEFN